MNNAPNDNDPPFRLADLGLAILAFAAIYVVLVVAFQF